MNGLFITGTDTDIGKTVLSALLLAELRRRGINVAPMKPAQTGCVNAVPDLDYSLSMAGMTMRLGSDMEPNWKGEKTWGYFISGCVLPGLR